MLGYGAGRFLNNSAGHASYMLLTAGRNSTFHTFSTESVRALSELPDEMLSAIFSYVISTTDVIPLLTVPVKWLPFVNNGDTRPFQTQPCGLK